MITCVGSWCKKQQTHDESLDNDILCPIFMNKDAMAAFLASQGVFSYSNLEEKMGISVKVFYPSVFLSTAGSKLLIISGA